MAAPRKKYPPPPPYTLTKAYKKKMRDCRCATKWDFAELCEFLVELSAWLQWFNKDYTKVRIALCNVERQAFSGTGQQSKRFCKNGPGQDPPPPPPPPRWG